MSNTDDRIVNSEGAPFGPILAKMLREEQRSCFASKDADRWFRLGAVFDMAAGYIEAVVEGKGPDSARIARLEAALTCAAVPLEVLAATECDDAGKALAPTTKAAVLRGRDAIRAALEDKS